MNHVIIHHIISFNHPISFTKKAIGFRKAITEAIGSFWRYRAKPKKARRRRIGMDHSSKHNTKLCLTRIFAHAIILPILVLQRHATAFAFVTDKGNTQLPKTTTPTVAPLQTSKAPDQNLQGDPQLSSRRVLLKKILATTAGATLVSSTHASDAAAAPTSTKSNTDPEVAYGNLRKAREELVVAGRTYFPKRDWEGLREYLDNEDLFINKYDENASALLTSKRLDAESKQAIGTIRRYGVGADVIIMYGGLKAEISEDNERPNPVEIEKYFVKTLDSLEEVIAIVRSNPGFSKIS